MRNVYLERYAYPEALIATPPAKDLELIVTIPCYNEKSLIPCLESLLNCTISTGISVEVIAIINEPENTPPAVNERNTACFHEAVSWCKQHPESALTFNILYEQLPKKHAGVGLARKMVMDEAVKRFESMDKDGIIVCYDADCSCDNNYLTAIFEHFVKNPTCPGASIYFEHPLEGNQPDEIYDAIIEYELFLRYYVNGLRYANFPYAFETIGSSMAVKSKAYQKQGGMNKRKAGEDFYFLHRIIPLGGFGEINTTRVIPSPRPSDRVPFGTGKAVNQWLTTGELLTYDPQVFEELKSFLVQVPNFISHNYSSLALPESIEAFLQQQDFETALSKIKKNAASKATFIKQFYQWFDGFKVLKYVHFTRDHYYPNFPVKQAAKKLWQKLETVPSDHWSTKELLMAYRTRDREGIH